MSEISEKQVIGDSLGVGIGVGAYGISFGALATASGLDVLQTCLLSLVAFTGGSQFAFIGVVGAGGAPTAGALTAVLLGGRNTFYGMSLARLLDVRGWRRWATAHLIIDESTAMAITRPTQRLGRIGFYWTGLTIFLVWNLMTLIGALAGNAIGDPRAFGLDAVAAAAFLGLLWPRLDTTRSRLVALGGLLAALALVPLAPAGVPIIVGGLAAVAVGMLAGADIAPSEDGEPR